MTTYLDLIERSMFLYGHEKSENRDFAMMNKGFSSKHEVLSEFFQNLKILHFSWHII
eukprot:UN24022